MILRSLMSFVVVFLLAAVSAAADAVNRPGAPASETSRVDNPVAQTPAAPPAEATTPAEENPAGKAVPGESSPADKTDPPSAETPATPAASSEKPAKAQDQDALKKDAFLRIVLDDDKTPTAMETAIVTYRAKDADKDALTVDLVAAVHIGEKSYYAELNREFKKYDVVLYELVAPEGTRVPRGGATASSNPVSLLQNTMKDMLELEYQLTEVDYTAKNFVHADMSPEQFTQSMDDRDESFLAMFLRTMGYAIARQEGGGGPSDAQVLLALFDKNRALALRRIMASQFQDIEGSMAAIEGPNGSTLIGERNKAALKVLREQIADGKKKIAIFYGGGHMPDFQRRLRDDFGLLPVETRWLVAWKMESPKPE